MCDKCDAKALELDGDVPHFIDALNGRGYSLQQPGMIEALNEYRAFTERMHR
ncbi:MAG: hypothetical protein KGI38_12305 [Thaumarchaeota archaeon]|nr:hypothetical protein [Nitrososphaerota archaeon]